MFDDALRIELGNVIDLDFSPTKAKTTTTTTMKKEFESQQDDTILTFKDVMMNDAMDIEEFGSSAYYEYDNVYGLEETFDLDKHGFEEFLFPPNINGDVKPTTTTSSLTTMSVNTTTTNPTTHRSDPDLSTDSGMDGESTDCSSDSPTSHSGGSSPNANDIPSPITHHDQQQQEQQQQQQQHCHQKQYISKKKKTETTTKSKSKSNSKITTTSSSSSIGTPPATTSASSSSVSLQSSSSPMGLRKGPRNVETLVASITDREKKVLGQIPGYKFKSNSSSLSKTEERELRRELRKIRNKDSAIKSRRKKEERIKGLEAEMATCTALNLELESKVTNLEGENKSLLEQLDELRMKLFRQAAENNLGVLAAMVVACCAVRIDCGGGGSVTMGPEQRSEYRSRTLKSAMIEQPKLLPFEFLVESVWLQACAFVLILAIMGYFVFRKRFSSTSSRVVIVN